MVVSPTAIPFEHSEIFFFKKKCADVFIMSGMDFVFWQFFLKFSFFLNSLVVLLHCRCWIVWRFAQAFRICAASIRRSVGTGNWPSLVNCTTPCGEWSAPRRLRRGRPWVWWRIWPWWPTFPSDLSPLPFWSSSRSGAWRIWKKFRRRPFTGNLFDQRTSSQWLNPRNESFSQNKILIFSEEKMYSIFIRTKIFCSISGDKKCKFSILFQKNTFLFCFKQKILKNEFFSPFFLALSNSSFGSFEFFRATKIFVNGAWVGIHRDPEQLMATLRKLRRQMDIIVSEVSMVRDIRDREIRISTDAGRICRPLLIVENQKLLLQRKHIDLLSDRQSTGYGWQDLIAGGVLEYIDIQGGGDNHVRHDSLPSGTCAAKSQVFPLHRIPPCVSPPVVYHDVFPLLSYTTMCFPLPSYTTMCFPSFVYHDVFPLPSYTTMCFPSFVYHRVFLRFKISSILKEYVDIIWISNEVSFLTWKIHSSSKAAWTIQLYHKEWLRFWKIRKIVTSFKIEKVTLKL